MDRQALKAAAMRLDEDERRSLAYELLESVEGEDEEFDAEVSAELDRRLEDCRRNPHDTLTWEQVKARLMRDIPSLRDTL